MLKRNRSSPCEANIPFHRPSHLLKLRTILCCYCQVPYQSPLSCARIIAYITSLLTIRTLIMPRFGSNVLSVVPAITRPTSETFLMTTVWVVSSLWFIASLCLGLKCSSIDGQSYRGCCRYIGLIETRCLRLCSWRNVAA